ncbi:methyltransferase [Miltoncostaea marina]|uniref:methyltransferase n=1 Tax=Miltoncostaea marina TaxID=2843215 RepID=UPI001C3C7F74|nr:methyltransferase [Miltoncostaea marina]
MTAPHEIAIPDEAALVAAAVALGAAEVPGWSDEEDALARACPAPAPSRGATAALRAAIAAGDDPLGEAFCRLRGPERRRPDGATYTPAPIVESMVRWAAAGARPERVVDPGAGSGRFAVAAARAMPRARVVAVERDPLAALACRAHLAAAGLAGRARVVAADYRTADLGDAGGRTLFLGNPPYVRHHQIPAGWKEWLALTARAHGLEASRLAGLHVHFFLATAVRGRPGDGGAFITSSEWLDTNYGRLVRELLLGPLGGEAVHVVEPTATPFEDAAVTAAITCFHVGRRRGPLRLRRVASVGELGALTGGVPVAAERLAEARRWSPLTRAARAVPPGHVELGDLCRVHRGAVTGRNATWVVRPGQADLPEAVLFPAVTRAREIFDAGPRLERTDHLRLVVDLPADLDRLDAAERRRVERFLRRARRDGAHDGYIARARRAWWSVGLRSAAPILATYMARRPPAFTRNLAGARHINIAHGLYPRVELPDEVVERLVAALRRTVSVEDGRTYAGGLTKFEPREMERLAIPDPFALEHAA